MKKLHVVELEVARRLISKGYRVRHLSGVKPAVLAAQDPSVSPLLDIAGEIGVEFVYNPTKEQYHRRLAEASVVVTTSIADMLPSSMVEAVHLGAVPVAPASMCFPEFIHRDNLYDPYDLQEIVSIVENRPHRQHCIDQFRSRAVMDRLLGEMPL